MPETEFTCSDCGRLVVAFGYEPADRRCISCSWVRANVPSHEQTAVRERLGVPLKTPAE